MSLEWPDSVSAKLVINIVIFIIKDTKNSNKVIGHQALRATLIIIKNIFWYPKLVGILAK